MRAPVFPKWANNTRAIFGALFVIGPIYLIGLIWYTFSPNTTDIGYEPTQPVPYSHALHAGELGIDCRYCHNTVDSAAFAALPPAETCMNCHQRIWPDSPKLALVRESAKTGTPIRWRKVYDLPDYAYFNHSAHVSKGVGCVTCHGRVDQMVKVSQVTPLSMAWCLDCHRNPEPNLRPLDKITDMQWKPSGDPLALGAGLRAQHHVNPQTDCSTCHR